MINVLFDSGVLEPFNTWRERLPRKEYNLMER